MTTLITGAGLVGCHTARVLVDRGEDVILFGRDPSPAAIGSVVDTTKVTIETGDILETAHLRRVLESRNVDRIVHTAALMTAAIRQDPLEGVRVNVLGTASVLEAARQTGVGKFVFGSSSTVVYSTFGRATSAPYPADFPMNVVSERPGSIYAASKLSAEHLALLYGDQYGLDVVVLRYAAVLGLWGGPNNSIVGRLMLALLTPAVAGRTALVSDPLLVWQGGEEFIEARDAAAALLPSPRDRVHFISSGRLETFDDFLAALRVIVPEARVEVSVQPKGGLAGFRFVRTQPSDIRSAQRDFGFRPQLGIAESMASAVPLIKAGLV